MIGESEFGDFVETLSDSTMSFLLSSGANTDQVLGLMMENEHISMFGNDGEHLATVGASFNGIGPPQVWILLARGVEMGDDEALESIITAVVTFTSNLVEDYNVATTIYPASDVIRRTVFTSIGFTEVASFHASFVDVSIPAPEQIMAMLTFDSYRGNSPCH